MIPRSVINTLKCSLCRNSLSVFPVYTYGSRDTPVCGRCSVQDEFAPQRQDLFEELAQHIEFPCRYQNNGCIENLKPSEMKEHEERCPHKPCLCPILPLGSCQWEGEYTELFEHYNDVHPSLSYQDFLININVTESFENNYVFCQANETFVAQLKFDVREARFYCNVRYCGPALTANKFSYRACFLSKKKKYPSKVQSVEYGVIGPLATDNACIVNVVDIVTNLNYAVWSAFQIDIFVRKIPTVEATVNPAKDNDILKMIECPICLDYMLPPILQCSMGHSFCESCRNQIEICPTCKGAVGQTRNYLLEQITNVIDYPCRYEKFGCTFYAGADQIRNHESNCQNGPQKCVINDCPWEDKSTQLKEHIDFYHKDNILETNSVTYVLDNLIDSYEYIINKSGNMFKVEFTRGNHDFIWDLQAVGESKDCTEYMFALDFGSQTKERLYAQTAGAYHLSFTIEQLGHFIHEDMLIYKMHLFEIVPS